MNRVFLNAWAERINEALWQRSPLFWILVGTVATNVGWLIATFVAFGV